ncbi:MAG: DNA adenine methylase [Bacteroidales bacterium]
MHLNLPRPFLKWAGGKSQILKEIELSFPDSVFSAEFTCIEPFIDRGSVFFHISDNFKNLKKAIINDYNSDLLIVCRILASEPKRLGKTASFNAYYHVGFNDDQKGRCVFFAANCMNPVLSGCMVIPAYEM